MAQIIRIAYRVYRCCDCGNEIVTDTNHRGPVYPVCKGKCRTILNPHTANERVFPKQTKHEFVRDYEALNQ